MFHLSSELGPGRAKPGAARKHVIQLLNGVAVAKKSPSGPEPKYKGISEVVERIWAAGEHPWSKRLAEMLPLWLPHYQRRYGRLLPSQRRLTDQVTRTASSTGRRVKSKFLSVMQST